MGWLLIALATWEEIAFATNLPTVTELSTRRGTGPLVWACLGAFAIHLWEARDDRQAVLRSRTTARR